MRGGRARLLSNAVANYAGQLTTLLVGILLTPLIVARLGDSMYGVWALVLSVQGLGGLIDFGVTTSVVKYVAQHQARGEIDEINGVVSSSFFLHLFIGALAFLVTAAVAFAGLPLFHLTAPQLAEARPALLVAGASLMLGLPLGVLGSLLTGLRHYERSNAVNIVQTALTAGATVFALNNGGGPTALVLINGVGLVAAYLVKGALAARLLPGLRLSPRLATVVTLRRIGGYSVWLFLLDAATRVFYNADAVLIAGYLPVSAVTAYNLGFRPANAISYFAGPLVSVFLPAASELEARRATGELQRLLISGARLALMLTIPPALWLLFWGREALTVWVGPGHADALPVLYVFLGVFLVSAAQNPASVILRGMGRVRPLALAVGLEYVANIALSLWLIPRVGVVGAALGTLVPAVVNDLGWIPWLVCRTLGVPYRRFLLRACAGPALAALPAGALAWVAHGWLAEPTLAALAGGAALVGAAYGAGCLLFAAGPEEKAWLRDKLRARWRPRGGDVTGRPLP
jgi:O-antigen/teichoic acid export membrane protein